MKKIIDYILSALYLVFFGIILIVFDVLQRIALNIFGRKAHQSTVELLNFFIVYGWYLTGSTARFNQKFPLPKDRPVIFIANHQSMFDIPGIIWFLRKHTPLFVSKIELAKGIPSISYNLRKGGAALIDRKNKAQALSEIGRLGDHIHKHKLSAAIFPEGTRSRTGKLKEFATGGVAILMERCSEAVIVPVAIKNTGIFNPTGLFPLRSFTNMSWTTLEPIECKDKEVEQVILEAKEAIQAQMG